MFHCQPLDLQKLGFLKHVGGGRHIHTRVWMMAGGCHLLECHEFLLFGMITHKESHSKLYQQMHSLYPSGVVGS
jgi:hypothetical protein